MTGNRARPLNGHAKPVRGRRPAYLEPETGLDPAKPCVATRSPFVVVGPLTLNRIQGLTPRSLVTPRSLGQGLTPRSLGPAKPIRGRLPAYLKPETGLDPAKPSGLP